MCSRKADSVERSREGDVMHFQSRLARASMAGVLVVVMAAVASPIGAAAASSQIEAPFAKDQLALGVVSPKIMSPTILPPGGLRFDMVCKGGGETHG